MPNAAAWQGRRVFLTGHTGFKGGWLAHWLHSLGAEVHGYALAPSTTPNLFEVAGVQAVCAGHTLADVRDAAAVNAALHAAQPDVVFHLAAQPLVRTSYHEPLGTFSTNVMGTAHVLEAARACSSVRAVVVVTTDKCYQEQPGWPWPYRETDPLGGHDPYSASKACTELVAASYRSAFQFTERGVGLATVRAGNVIGGGDWTPERLVPDLLAACSAGQVVTLRQPHAVRPWQHVLEPLAGYITLAERLLAEPARFARAWNFGPDAAQCQPVLALVQGLQALARADGIAVPEARIEAPPAALHEAAALRLDASQAQQQLGWQGRLTLPEALALSWRWHAAWRARADMACVTRRQIADYAAAQLPSL
ncbi:CDP-glucose 4,6-dehydratase [Vitreoscilla filiformis]|uniref:CDP-glucose 4,6-dehydratase n=1 Tax=Vitreoscilla filiformis TaxID=63 RepID=A0A221KIE0_VITFI|nr:CDP-glucose 4,6-dehydratase [Vitreoscilla filiformis]